MKAPQVSISSPLSAAACWAAAARAVSGLPSAVVNSDPTINPRPRTSPTASVARSRAPESSWLPRSAALATNPSSSITLIVASAAAQETAFAP